MAKKKIAKRNNAKKAAPNNPASITETINSEIIAAALNSVNKPVLLKVCRLCEAKDGPFLNIFDADKIIAKKVEAIMPFVIAENDELPHKICFRCSAKVEELYEFIQKCIKTQNNLCKAVGSNSSINNKPRQRELWEEKLNKSNISNDDICDALIKKAMEGIKDFVPNLKNENETPAVNNVTKKSSLLAVKDNPPKDDIKDPSPTPKEPQEELESIITKSLRSRRELKTEVKSANVEVKPIKPVEKEEPSAVKPSKKDNTTSIATIPPVGNKVSNDKQTLKTNTFSLNETTKPPEPVFNIMDHVSMIKVNGVGVLFQCKICNRNFLKKEVVMSHACAKNGLTKLAGPNNVPAPEPPRIPSVKYINTKTQPEIKKPAINTTITLDDDEDDKPLAPQKPKPRIGPASKVGKQNSTVEIINKSNCKTPLIQIQPNPLIKDPVIQFPTLPSLNSRYKLVPGPNHTFTLVEEKGMETPTTSPGKAENAKKPASPIESMCDIVKTRQTLGTRKTPVKSQEKPVIKTSKLSQESTDRPYPVGLFKTNTGLNHSIQPEPVAFPTPAMKKQSYTIVQTGNPSKLLISSKPQNTVEEIPKKKLKKTKDKKDESEKQPFSVTLEDTAPPRDSGFFTFINVDPLLQPSYVLPTDNIIQESQISTSCIISKQNNIEKDDKYTCNMCNETFSREKKLLAHIQSHYSKMDEEDQIRAEKNPRKRKK